MPPRRLPSGLEVVLVARARRTISAQIAATVTILVLLAGGVALIVMMRSQSSSDQRQLKMVAARPMIGHPPAHVWEFRRTGATLSGTRGAPSYFPIRAVMDEVAARREALVAGYRIHGVDYLVRTQPVGDDVIQVALDLRSQERTRDEFYGAFAFFELVGLVAAVGTGQLLYRRAVAPLGKAIERQNRFVADASHELRTPLTQLHTRAQLLRHRLSRDSSVTLAQAELDGILASTRQFGEVIEDVLQSAQVRHEPRLRAPVDLEAIVAGVAAAESPRADLAGISIAVVLDPGSRDLVVTGIGPALRRALAALVDNALTHTAVGGHIELRLGTRPGGRDVEVSVRDDGVGFPPGDGEHIFARSRHSENGSGQRFGIGLALVREIIESHGGTITASGQPGQGAVFTVRLPRANRPLTLVRWPRLKLSQRFRGWRVGSAVAGKHARGIAPGPKRSRPAVVAPPPSRARRP